MLLKVNYKSQEICENYDWTSYSKKPIVDLIKELKELHENGYTAVEIQQDYDSVQLKVFRFETELELKNRLYREEKIVAQNLMKIEECKRKDKLRLIERAEKLGMKFVE